MKKITLLIFAFISMQMYSQEQFNVGINGGIPLGPVENVSNFAFGADVNYLFDLGQNIVIGPSLGFVLFNTEDEIDGVDIEPRTFVPISASFYFHSVDDKFYAGGELGYALAVSDVDGGVFIKPTVGYLITDSFKINVFYAGIKTREPTFAYGYAGLGLTYNLKGNQSRY